MKLVGGRHLSSCYILFNDFLEYISKIIVEAYNPVDTRR